MNSISPSQTSRALVQAFSSISSTEDLILFVAGTDNMLSFCQEIIEQYDRDDMAFMTMEINTLCAEYAILPGILYAEIRKVLLALNRFHDAGRDHYAILGLKEGAAIGEIKKAYRTLSKQYHPDLSGDDENATKHFMEIAGAYHAIMANVSETKSGGRNPWRNKVKDRRKKPRHDRKKFLFLVAVLVLLLIAVSIFLSDKYDELVNHSQMQNWAVQPDSQPSPEKQNMTEDVLPVVARPERQQPEIAVAPIYEPNMPPVQPSLPVTEKTNQLQTEAVAPQQIPVVPPEPTADSAAALPEITPQDEKKISVPAGETIPTGKPAVRGAENTRPKIEQQAASPKDNDHTGEVVTRLATVQTGSITSTKATGPVDRAEAIIKVLNRYSEFYSRKELNAFLALFTDDASENGQPVSTLINQYHSLFTHTRAIHLDFTDISWEEHQNGFQATGTFNSDYTYQDGRTKEHNGSITFFLTDREDGLKIQSLDYVFSH